MTVPTYARGFGGGGGGFRGGGGGGGFRGFGGGDRGFGGEQLLVATVAVAADLALTAALAADLVLTAVFSGGFAGDRWLWQRGFSTGGFGGRSGDTNLVVDSGGIAANHGGDFGGAGVADRVISPTVLISAVVASPISQDLAATIPTTIRPAITQIGVVAHFPTDGGFGNMSKWKNGNFSNNNFPQLESNKQQFQQHQHSQFIQ